MGYEPSVLRFGKELASSIISRFDRCLPEFYIPQCKTFGLTVMKKVPIIDEH
jgi:hypothetical protein